MSDNKFETEWTWGRGVQPDLKDDALSVKHLASLRRRQGMAENRAGEVAPADPGEYLGDGSGGGSE